MKINFRSSSIDACLASNCLKSLLKYEPITQRIQRKRSCEPTECQQVKHLICFKQWTARMVLEVVCSAIRLKALVYDSHQRKLDTLTHAKVMILQEVNQPILNMAVSKAASLLGADDVEITDSLVWDYDYTGRIFSDMADIIFVSTKTHMCLQRFANTSTVPVICMQSRTHAGIQALATIMTIMEQFGRIQDLNIAWVGPPHPVLNSYLLLMPMLGANIRFKCCCKECPVSPLLMKASKELIQTSSTISKQCQDSDEVLCKASVIIAGPTTKKKDKLSEFVLSLKELNSKCSCPWIFLHTCPRGTEVENDLFNHCNARTFTAFQNMHYIAAALMAYHKLDINHVSNKIRITLFLQQEKQQFCRKLYCGLNRDHFE